MDHRNPDSYRFDDYLAALGDDWVADDPQLERWLARSDLDPDARALVTRFGTLAATDFRDTAEIVERHAALPYLGERGPYNRGRRDVVLPAETWRALGEVHGSGLWRASLDERARYAIVYLLNQNGEFGVTCSTACTDGMARLLRRHDDHPRSREVIDALERATPESWIHGAQFVTEVQGGSDAATNELVAEPIGDRLYQLGGQKWFCSNFTADYWLVTGRVPGQPGDHRGVGLFCVPRVWQGEPNGWVVERLKDKLGTRALPTAELRLEGARGWAVGPTDAGLKNMVAIVLSTSRIHNVIAAAGAQRRAVREARAYAGFRRAFGRTLEDHPLIAMSIERVAEAAELTTAGAFATVEAWLAGGADDATPADRLWARVLVQLSKAVVTRESSARIYEAMMVFGGNGIEERFTALPRLWRDAAIMETWEGPYTLLLMRALGDMARYGVADDVEGFVRDGFGDDPSAEDVAELEAILRAPDESSSIRAWGDLAPRLYRAFERKAHAELSG